jgi:hypothetical protein
VARDPASTLAAMFATLVRGLVAALLAASGLVLATGSPAAAECTCRQVGVEQQTRRADVVFTGTVDQVRTAGGSFEYDVTATRSYKGDVEREVVVQSPRGKNACGLGPIPAGGDYLFLAGGATSPYSTTTCDGSGPVTNKRTAGIQQVLGEGEAVEPPPPPKAQRTRVEDSAPASFARLAAPGAAAVIVGLLGLVVVGLRGRRG